ncbi:TraM recognition domain-containing protein [Lysinibacillus sphaericus]|uniref:TraM recognition domain-containing protein n=1 Tax=Lysinibacillus sphaericus TaxID=1421 RepID=UPI0018CF4EDB|nr:TraM recognition domain-containing protein [Lysinibacillus sphaericus]
MTVAYGEQIKLANDDIFTHTLIIGATRCGKTSILLKPTIFQILCMKKKGIKVGFSVIEPKGDLAEDVREMCDEMDIPLTHIDPTREDSACFNVMEGDIDEVAEATVAVLKGLFGKQDAFFATVQELSSRNVTKLIKRLRGDDLDITDVLRALREPELLRRYVNELKQKVGKMDDMVQFFENELLGTMQADYAKYVIGLRAQLENIISNSALKRIMTGKSDLDIQHHYESGGVLAVNTALGLLGRSGDAFGQFIMMHLMNGAFKRKGTERTRIPHILIVDEFAQYVNPLVPRFLNIGASFRVAGMFATQTIAQLAVESGDKTGKDMQGTIIAGCRNKIVFGGVSLEDANYFSDQFGKDRLEKKTYRYDSTLIPLPEVFKRSSYTIEEVEEVRFSPTDLIDGLPKFHYVCQLTQGVVTTRPVLTTGTFIPRDWKETRMWESDNISSMYQEQDANLTFGEKLKKRIFKIDPNARKVLEDADAEEAKQTLAREREELARQGYVVTSDGEIIDEKIVNERKGIKEVYFTYDCVKELEQMAYGEENAITNSSATATLTKRTEEPKAKPTQPKQSPIPTTEEIRPEVNDDFELTPLTPIGHSEGNIPFAQKEQGNNFVKPLKDELPKEDQLPMSSELPMENELPMGNELPMENELPMGNELPMENELPMGNELPMENELPMGNELPMENELPMGNELPMENELPMNNESNTLQSKVEESNKNEKYVEPFTNENGQLEKLGQDEEPPKQPVKKINQRRNRGSRKSKTKTISPSPPKINEFEVSIQLQSDEEKKTGIQSNVDDDFW